jgi:hypothetical protein
MKTMNRSTNSVYPWPRWPVLFLTVLLIGWFASSQTAQAINPPPDGGYPNGNTAEGQNAFFNLATYIPTVGLFNTAVGWHALKTLGMPTRLIVYPGEGHMFIEPKHQVDRLEQTMAWFDKYLK